MQVAAFLRSKVPSARISLLWLVLALLNASQAAVEMNGNGEDRPWGKFFLMLFASWLVWLVATPWVVWLGRIAPPLRWKSPRIWPIHIAAMIVITLIFSAWIAFLEISLSPFGTSEPPPAFAPLWLEFFVSRLYITLLIYVAILAISHTLDARERLASQETTAATLSAELAKAQLDALRRQLEPHFIFNTLNAIAGALRQRNNATALTMVVGLGDLLRRVLDSSDGQRVALGEEVDFLETYLSIQSLRFGNRLRSEVDVPQNLLSAEVPCLILQPLVENAIEHGIAMHAKGGLVRIAAALESGSLNITVYNDGPSLTASHRAAVSGIGLANVRGRLRSLYGENCSLDIRNRDEGGVEACLRLPYATGLA
jgi:two-component system LytT family sensor kinase